MHGISRTIPPKSSKQNSPSYIADQCYRLKGRELYLWPLSCLALSAPLLAQKLDFPTVNSITTSVGSWHPQVAWVLREAAGSGAGGSQLGFSRVKELHLSAPAAPTGLSAPDPPSAAAEGWPGSWAAAPCS